ncbi:ribosomal protection-like ABC-F family protein [Virgibacillus kekensis]|uniref:Ribosomal protection-like ABC-F family protein n=1 Tax=Virgibacillus kekensis TaxID=202261 RepID=A0ABV9DMC7_9BACI
MHILKAQNLRKEINGETLFENISLEVNEGEHIALYGRNGIGKTTLLKGLSGKELFDDGDIHRVIPGHEWGWLDQSPAVDGDHSAKDFVLGFFADWFTAKKAMDRALADLQGEAGMAAYEKAFARFTELGGYELEVTAETTLSRLGLNAGIWSQPFHSLSGGQKTKVQLAGVLLKEPKMIIMDEPTNHLDKETIEWLEEWIRQYHGALLYVSHDRYFLDKTADAIYELTREGCTRYTGGYSDYKEQKEVEARTQERNYRKYVKKKKELKETIRRYEQWFHKAHGAAGTDDFLRAKAKKNISRYKAKESELARLENEGAKKPAKDKRINMSLDAGGFSARTLVRVDGLNFSFQEEKLFCDLNFTVDREDRIAIIGPNGAGKSTLLKLLIGDLVPDEGAVQLNPQTRIGYFDQELGVLNKGKTLLESLLSLPDMTQTEARTILGSFLFRRDAVHKRIGELSMGEKCRAAFIKLYFSEANLLVLDEPTNFLDVDTRETVEDVIQSYPGAMIAVSHDRYFVKKFANRIIFLNGDKVVDYRGSYDDFVEHLEKRVDTAGQEWKNEREQLEIRLAELLGLDGEIGNKEAYWKEVREIKRKLGR